MGFREQRALQFMTLLRQSGTGPQHIAHAVDRTDVSTYGHSERVAHYALVFGRAQQLDGETLDRLRIAGLLQDLGMVLCPEEIRRKPARLTAEEYAQIKLHPVDTADLLARIPQYHQVAPITRHHHERYDGLGYPDGLRAAQIPLESRILAVVDAYDAMVSARPYRPPLGIEQAIDQIMTHASTQFDPVLATSFALFIRERWSARMQRHGAATIFAELSVRAHERSLRDLLEHQPDATPQILAALLQMQFPEIGPEQAGKLVAAQLFPGQLPDDLYGDHIQRIKDDEVRLVFPARIDADVRSLVRFEGKLFLVLDIDEAEDGQFTYHLKR